MSAAAQGNTGDWSAVINLSADQAKFASEKLDSEAASVGIQDVTRSLSDSSLHLSGTQGVEQLRAALFDDAATIVDFLGGPVDLKIIIPAGYGSITLQLETRMSAGYQWELLPGSDVSSAGEVTSSFQTRYRGLGAPSIQTMQLHNNSPADQQVHLVYRRSFEKDRPLHASLILNAANIGNVINISDPSPKEPAAPADGIQAADGFKALGDMETMVLPAAFDWRNQGVVPAVRDQGGCGSCWAFGTVAVMESAVKIGGGPLTDLSEQFLISCNKEGWNCNGGLTASSYHTSLIAKSQTEAGAVLESVKPYTESNGTCTLNLPHPYKADSWQFITGSEYTVPTVDQIKAAIYTYGPITAGVCAGSGWDTYTSGVFSKDESSQCSGSTNHQIVLVGWNDATQSWILRNSWGSGWGIGGYMLIKWGVSRVGEGTSWIKYTDSSVTLTPVNTSLPSNTPTMTFTLTPSRTPVNTFTKTPSRTPSNTPTSSATRNPINTRTPSFTPAKSNTPAPGASLTPSRTPTRTPVNTSTPRPTATASAIQPTQAGSPLTSIYPSGKIYSTRPSYTWLMNKSTAYYRLRVTDVETGNYILDGIMVNKSNCKSSTGKCTVTPSSLLEAEHDYTWQVAAGEASYNTETAFHTIRGFNSQFNENADNWLAGAGSSWTLGSTSIYSNGTSYETASIHYDQDYEDFTFQARIKRAGTSGFSTGLIVRGEPVFDANYDWPTSYQFLYRQDGTFSVWRGLDGSWTAIKPWSFSRLIIKNNWNILKVTAVGNQLEFSINNQLVWSGQDENLSSGQAGVWMYRENGPETVYVDWASLEAPETLKGSKAIETAQKVLPLQADRFGRRVP